MQKLSEHVTQNSQVLLEGLKHENDSRVQEKLAEASTTNDYNPDLQKLEVFGVPAIDQQT